MIKKAIIFMFLFASMINVGYAKKDVFTKEQRAEIEKMVEEVLINDPSIFVRVVEKIKQNEENERVKKQSEKISANLERFDAEHDPFLGKDGKDVVYIYHFFDYNCGYCKVMSKTILEMAEKLENVKIVMKETPIFGEDSEYAARAGLYANQKGKFKEFYKEMMSTKARANEETVSRISKNIGLNVKEMKKFVDSKEAKDSISQNTSLAIDVEIQSLPTTMIGQKLFPGALSYDEMAKLVSEYKEFLKKENK
ncbi:MAG: DSBA-like thioredoxin domain protein [Alphaproteobacteria bacterium ADurb.Bin438]|nr:MAG: DSBA-like thioredoxin domain protein [Alphaproteobacteria bacterium ADurb.Bin438]